MQPSFAGGEMIVVSVLNETAIVYDLIPGVTYNFTVIAYNEIGNSSDSQTLPLKTLEEGI